MRRFILLIKVILNIPQGIFSKISILAFVHLSEIHPTVAIQRTSRVYWSKIDKYSYISNSCWIIKCEIGAFCSIASNVTIGGGEHPINFVSTSPVFYSRENILKTCFNEVPFEEYNKTVIGNDVWIGFNAFIKGGITIGNGAVIGAHAVVTKDVPAYSIVVGNPAKIIRKRFDDSTIQRLEDIKWWDFTDEVLKKKASYFQKVGDFLSSEDCKEVKT